MSYFPTKILLATDGSEDAAVATRAAVDLANRSGSKLHVMHAFEFIPPREYMSVALRLHSSSDFSRQGQRLLDEQVELIGKAGGTVAGAHLRMGSPVDQILYASEELGRSEEHTSELQSRQYLVCRLLLEKKKHDPHLLPRSGPHTCIPR